MVSVIQKKTNMYYNTLGTVKINTYTNYTFVTNENYFEETA